MKKTILAACAAALLTGTGCLNMGDALSNLNNQLLLTTLLTANSGKFLAFTNTNVLYESDGLGTWTRVSFTGATKLTKVAASGSTLYGIDGATANTLYKSTDSGRTWSTITVAGTGTFGGIAACGSSVVVGYSTTSVLAAYSANGGTSWTTAATISGASAVAVTQMACSGQNFYAVMNSVSSEFGVSTNGGASWTSSNPGASASSNATVGLPNGGSDVVLYFYFASPEGFVKSNNTGTSFAAGGSFGTFSSFSGALKSANSKFVAGFTDSSSNTCYIATMSATGSSFTNSSPAAISCSGYAASAVNGGNQRYAMGAQNGSNVLLFHSTDGTSLTSDSLAGLTSGVTQITDIAFIP